MDVIEQSLIDKTADLECRECRQTICNRCNMLPEAIADVLYSKKERVFQFTDEVGEKAIRHLRECSDCQSWFKSLIPEAIRERYERAAHYCCMLMFCAIEENEDSRMPKVSFMMYRGEDPIWTIDEKMALPISYCPWCAATLPNEPFR